jgi:hypothetical protein
MTDANFLFRGHVNRMDDGWINLTSEGSISDHTGDLVSIESLVDTDNATEDRNGNYHSAAEVALQIPQTKIALRAHTTTKGMLTPTVPSFAKPVHSQQRLRPLLPTPSGGVGMFRHLLSAWVDPESACRTVRSTHESAWVNAVPRPRESQRLAAVQCFQ